MQHFKFQTDFLSKSEAYGVKKNAFDLQSFSKFQIAKTREVCDEIATGQRAW